MATMYSIAVKSKGKWELNESSYDRETIEEQLEYVQCYPQYDGARIVASLDVTEEINETIAELNK